MRRARGWPDRAGCVARAGERGRPSAGSARRTSRARPDAMSSEPRPTLITGGAGFIGTNVAHRLLSSGAPVLLFDNLSRPGVEGNLRWLRQVHRERVQVEIADMRDGAALRAAVARAGRVFHFAGQTAVTTSLRDPLH